MELVRIETVQDISSLILDRQVSFSVELPVAGSRRTSSLILGHEAMFLMLGRVQLDETYTLGVEIEVVPSQDGGDPIAIGNVVYIPK